VYQVRELGFTAGVIGFVDVAKMIDLPKHHEDFGQTLGTWGVPAGNYLVVPFLGASSPRELVGSVGDALLNPLTYTFVFAGSGAAISAVNAGARAVEVTDTRAGLMPTEKLVDEASVDRYDFIKNAYQQRREYLLHDGNVPEQEELQLDDDVSNDSQDTSQKEGAPSASEAETSGLAQPTDKPKHFLQLSPPASK
jgi:phospholipid-binding lipoprotein MlaA